MCLEVGKAKDQEDRRQRREVGGKREDIDIKPLYHDQKVGSLFSTDMLLICARVFTHQQLNVHQWPWYSSFYQEVVT